MTTPALCIMDRSFLGNEYLYVFRLDYINISVLKVLDMVSEKNEIKVRGLREPETSLPTEM